MLLSGPPPDEHAFAVVLGKVLRSGVLLAAAIVLAGGVIYVARRGSSTADFAVFRSEPVEFRSVQGIIAEATAGSGRGLIQLGLLVLIATPILRVLFSVVGFWHERDFAYVVLTLIVLGVLAYSLLAA
jgi:uncharacterized membrane protein